MTFPNKIVFPKIFKPNFALPMNQQLQTSAQQNSAKKSESRPGNSMIQLVPFSHLLSTIYNRFKMVLSKAGVSSTCMLHVDER
mmetsp:Transcript_18667/g.45791  ORF Transcript_18667/g.45791 Transcript_18667/m.45791 type:complete len:83 (+) Transcript_18667:526-774(+)